VHQAGVHTEKGKKNREEAPREKKDHKPTPLQHHQKQGKKQKNYTKCVVTYLPCPELIRVNL